MTSALTRAEQQQRELTLYDPEEGLKTIAVAEAGETHWRRAKDASKLIAAVEAKIEAQAEYIVWRDGVSPRRGTHGGDRKSDQVLGLKLDLPAADPGAGMAHRWRKRFTSKHDGRTVRDDERIAKVLDDARLRCVRICEQDSTTRGTEGTGENEWFTPAEYVELARAVLGAIDLDPASSDRAQQVIKAAHYFTKADDGLKHEWCGRVWLNPPYAQPLIADFVSKMVAERVAGRVTAAIMLTHNYTDTAWFHEAAGACDAICFTRGRVKFYEPDGEIAAPTQGQAFFYFGADVDAFFDQFKNIGFVVEVRH